MRYYIADLHFCHSNLNQRMDRRGFESGEAMTDIWRIGSLTKELLNGSSITRN